MGGSMGKRKKRQAAKRRGLTEEQRLRRRAKTRAELLYDPAAPPEEAAEVLRELFGEDPVEPDIAAAIASRTGVERLRAVAEAALAHARDPLALSFASDATILDGRADESEELARQALELLDVPELRGRLARALSSQGRMTDAVDVLDAELRSNPGLATLLAARCSILEQVARRTDLPAPERRVIDRFADRTALEDLRAAIGEHLGAGDDGAGSFADGLQEWIEAGAIGDEELTEWAERAAVDPGSSEALRLRLVGEWAWLMPLLDDDRAPLEALTEDESATEELRQGAEDWLNMAFWGLWEVEDPTHEPGVVVVDLVSGLRLHAEVPGELLNGLPRWSVLLGYLVPIAGYWHGGSAFEVASPVEARILVHELLDDVMANADEIGPEGRPMLTWARRVHDDLGPLWRPETAAPPSQEAMTGLQLALRAFAPHLVAGIRAMRGTSPIEPSTAAYALTLDDPEAAWRALAAHAEFETAEDDGLVWLPAGEDEDDEERAYLDRTEDGEIEVEADRDELAGLLDLLRGLGHAATAEELPEDDEPPQPPVAVPDLPAEELRAWLSAWPDEPLDVFDEITPRRAVELYGAAPAVEMLIRYLEHDADRRGVELDTRALRQELEKQ
jgi:hypothetical protein